MELTVLGCSGSYNGPDGHPCSGYLVREGASRVWIDCGTGTFGVNYADTPEQGRAQVARYKAAGFVQMKIYQRIQPEVVRAISEEAHRVGMTPTGFVGCGCSLSSR